MTKPTDNYRNDVPELRASSRPELQLFIYARFGSRWSCKASTNNQRVPRARDRSGREGRAAGRGAKQTAAHPTSATEETRRKGPGAHITQKLIDLGGGTSAVLREGCPSQVRASMRTRSLMKIRMSDSGCGAGADVGGLEPVCPT